MAAVRTRAFSVELDTASCALYPPVCAHEQQHAHEQQPVRGEQSQPQGAAVRVAQAAGGKRERTPEGAESNSISAIVPIADMLNHSTDASTAYDVSCGEFRVSLCASQTAGAEALLCYQVKAH